MKRSIDYSKMPTSYAVCWNKECRLADTCLRFSAAINLSSERKESNSVNLNSVNWEDGKCGMFHTTQMVKVAYGIKNLYDEVPRKKAVLIHAMLEAEFGKNRYYDYYNSRKPIPPRHQDFIHEVFARICPNVEVCFDRFDEEVLWNS